MPRNATTRRLTDVLPRLLLWLTAFCVLVQLLSLRLGWLNGLFFDGALPNTQGTDYFSLPRAWLNLIGGHSEYDTFGGVAYGGMTTLYLSHPALGVWLGSWLSVGMMSVCAWLLGREARSRLLAALLWLFVLGAFPTYTMLWVGNIQALLVLALTLLFCAMLRLLDGRRAHALLLAGLLLSLLSKPVVVLMLPLLLLMKETRRAVLESLGVYVVVSAVFELVPALNPQAIPLSQVIDLALHPAVVQRTMNVYTNGYRLTPPMKDNSFHWLNLIAQSSYRFAHIDVYSLPVFLDQLLGVRTPNWLYQAALLATVALSVPVARMQDPRRRRETALLLLLAISLTFFLCYPTVWEYQYTGALVAIGVLWLLVERGTLPRWVGLASGAAGVCLWLPSLYVFVRGWHESTAELTLIRLDRVVPVLALFVVLLALIVSRLVVSRLTQPTKRPASNTAKQTAGPPAPAPAA